MLRNTRECVCVLTIKEKEAKYLNESNGLHRRVWTEKRNRRNSIIIISQIIFLRSGYGVES